MPLSYPIVLFDFDHTLFDFEASKLVAFREVLAAEGYDNAAEYLDHFRAVERPLWARLEQGDLTLDTLNDERFARLVEATGLDADPSRMASGYLHWLGRSGGLLPGARALLEELQSTHTLGLVSNGYSEVMRARLPNFDLEHYFDVVIVSSEVGAAKPDPQFLDAAFAELGQPDRATVLLVGDSLTSDMAAAHNYGLSSCWYNPALAEAPASPPITHIVQHLDEIPAIVR